MESNSEAATLRALLREVLDEVSRVDRYTAGLVALRSVVPIWNAWAKASFPADRDRTPIDVALKFTDVAVTRWIEGTAAPRELVELIPAVEDACRVMLSLPNVDNEPAGCACMAALYLLVAAADEATGRKLRPHIPSHVAEAVLISGNINDLVSPEPDGTPYALRWLLELRGLSLASADSLH